MVDGMGVSTPRPTLFPFCCCYYYVVQEEPDLYHFLQSILLWRVSLFVLLFLPFLIPF